MHRENDRNNNCAPVVRKIAFCFVGMFIALHEKVYCHQLYNVWAQQPATSNQQLWIWNFRCFLFCSLRVFRWFRFTLSLLSVIFLFYFYYIRFGSIKFDCIASNCRCACMRVICNNIHMLGEERKYSTICWFCQWREVCCGFTVINCMDLVSNFCGSWIYGHEKISNQCHSQLVVYSCKEMKRKKKQIFVQKTENYGISRLLQFSFFSSLFSSNFEFSFVVLVEKWTFRGVAKLENYRSYFFFWKQSSKETSIDGITYRYAKTLWFSHFQTHKHKNQKYINAIIIKAMPFINCTHRRDAI